MLVQSACSSTNFEPITRPHPSMQGQQKLLTAMAMFSLCSNVESTTRLCQRTDLVSHFANLFKALWPAEQAPRNARHFAPFVRECISSCMATLACAHGTAILTNCGPSKLVAERIFYALQVNIIRKMIICFVVP